MQAPNDTSTDTPLISETRLKWIMFLVTGATFMEILDGTIITPALPAMAKTFGTSALALNVGVSGYLLALGVFIPASSWVADRFGARKVFASALALFTLSSALCGLCHDLYSFVALRIVQGIAGAMMNPVGRLVMMRYTPRERLMQVMQSIIWPALIAPVLGPPIGGFITEHANWRWIFLLNVPLGIAALIAALMLVPAGREATPRRFDLTGFLWCGSGTFALLAGLEWVVEQTNAASIGLLALGLFLLGMSIRHFRRVPTPLLDLSIYGIATFRTSARGGSLSRMAIGAAPFLLPLMFQVGFGYDAFHSGLLTLAVFAGNVGMKVATTQTLRRFGFRPVLIWNGLLCALSIAACALLSAQTPGVWIFALLFASGMARSMQFTAFGTIAFADVPKPQMSDANSLFNTVSQISMAAGITLGALAVRAGRVIAEHFNLHAPGADYRIAFVLVGGFALLSLIDSVKLPKDAADHFVARTAKR